MFLNKYFSIIRNHNFLYFILIEGNRAAFYDNKRASVTMATDTKKSKKAPI